ncbi:MAG TPA: prolyl oligopeptidase family serine peptidase [Edaphobacter sp.]|jgi:prolyl oligopeptidase|nr:prolyl oligopeptidase family serine peptidase [Edaphobacter sp.]
MQRSALFVAAAVFLGAIVGRAQVQGRDGIKLPNPPVVKTEPVVDEYKSEAPGVPTKITDPYRWLEDAHSPETRAYITAQNAYTAQYFSQVKMLPAVVDEMGKLLKVDFVSVPTRRGDRYFFSKRLADENQASIYMRVGLHGVDEKLIDAAKLSADQNTSVNTLNLTEDGSMMAYGVRVGGADEVEVHFLDVATRESSGDVMPRARYSGVDISPDKAGVYYSKLFPHEGNRVFYHKFGTPLDSDVMILGKEYRGEKLGEIDGVSVRATSNGHYLVFRIGRGVPATREDILIKDLRVPDSPIVPLVYGIDSRFSEFNAGDTFYMRTDYKAPNGRVLKVVEGKGPDEWPVIIPEGKDVLEAVNVVGGKMYVLRLKDVKSEVTIYSLEGKAEGHIVFAGIGAGSTLSGRAGDTDGFYTFQSIIAPPTIFHYDTRTGRSEVFYSDKVPFDSTQYEVKQVFYTSKDGTKVPMFIAGKKGLKRDGSERLLMTGYGGFALSETPVWNPEYTWWMQQGGWFALPNLRGGNEYGEGWHKAAMFDKKQNVFDDWFAAAEYLIANKYTTPERFAIRGRSNGGLLMGASMTQRPDLFGAIWCGYPLLDMLRYQMFEMGRTWTTEYGSAENAKDYPYILKYSPYQNVKAGTKYPAIFFFTGDGDTRVDPMNARKMTPLMQTSTASGRPILLHYSLKGGHSAGVSQTQLVQDYADEMAFLWTETGTK